jgi:hypothetical protein
MASKPIPDPSDHPLYFSSTEPKTVEVRGLIEKTQVPH